MRMAMNYKRSISINAILIEINIPFVKDWLTYLASNYLVKAISNNSFPFLNILTDFYRIHRKQMLRINPETQNNKMINIFFLFFIQLDGLHSLVTAC